tara:strand:- start:7604 stop:8443 length:840 start_codon:yes stop_codon:yes gene_type:complete
MSNKILVTSGCSFTADEPTWAHHLADQIDVEHHNVAMSGAGNHIISSEVIRKVELLLKDGVNTSDLLVGVQWSGLFRFDLVVNNGLDSPIKRPVHLANGCKIRQWDYPSDTENTWIMTAGSTALGFWPSYYLLMSKEQTYTQTLEQILRVQWYLKSKNIQYFMFTGWDIFTEGTKGERSHLGNDVMSKPNQFTDEIYDSSEHILISDNCKWFGYLFDMIDFDCFWTHNSATTKKGGMVQWLRETQSPHTTFISSNNYHPSSKSHAAFANDVLRELIKNV